jgi:hypothetical protein
VDLGDGRQRFEAKTEPHEHIRCQRCGRIAEVPDCHLGDSASRVRQLTGFVVTQHRLLLSGLCPSLPVARPGRAPPPDLRTAVNPGGYGLPPVLPVAGLPPRPVPGLQRRQTPPKTTWWLST